MKTKFKFFLLILFAFIVINSRAQENNTDQSKVTKHTHPEYEKEIEEMKDAADQAKHTYQKAEETYQVSEKYMESSKRLYDDFYNLLKTLVAIIAIAISIGVFAYFKKVKNYYKKQYESVFEKIKQQQDNIVIRLVDTEKWGEDLRKEARLVVFNIKGTEIQLDFSKVVKFFASSIFLDIDSFDEKLIMKKLSNLQMGKLGVVIIEDSDGKLNLNKANNELNNKMVDLANRICPTNGLFYFGPGQFPITEIKEQSVKNMVSFTNAPAQFYGNLMNLLKFKSIVQQ